MFSKESFSMKELQILAILKIIQLLDEDSVQLSTQVKILESNALTTLTSREINKTESFFSLPIEGWGREWIGLVIFSISRNAIFTGIIIPYITGNSLTVHIYYTSIFIYKLQEVFFQFVFTLLGLNLLFFKLLLSMKCRLCSAALRRSMLFTFLAFW